MSVLFVVPDLGISLRATMLKMMMMVIMVVVVAVAFHVKDDDDDGSWSGGGSGAVEVDDGGSKYRLNRVDDSVTKKLRLSWWSWYAHKFGDSHVDIYGNLLTEIHSGEEKEEKKLPEKPSHHISTLLLWNMNQIVLTTLQILFVLHLPCGWHSPL